MPRPCFYSKGVRFECQGTGKCCKARGLWGYVYLTLADRRRLADYLGMGTRSFTRRYCQRSGDLVHLKQPERDCCFLHGTQCAVHEARPDQCRTWPFWPENMNARTWREQVAPFCCGVGKGRLHSLAEITELVARAAAVTGDDAELDLD